MYKSERHMRNSKELLKEQPFWMSRCTVDHQMDRRHSLVCRHHNLAPLHCERRQFLVPLVLCLVKRLGSSDHVGVRLSLDLLCCELPAAVVDGLPDQESLMFVVGGVVGQVLIPWSRKYSSLLSESRSPGSAAGSSLPDGLPPVRSWTSCTVSSSSGVSSSTSLSLPRLPSPASCQSPSVSIAASTAGSRLPTLALQGRRLRRFVS